MNIKLSRPEALILCSTLATEIDLTLFHTVYELDITTAVLKDFVKRLAKREYPQNNKRSSVKLTVVEITVLNKILPHIWTKDPYTNSLITLLTQDINQEWTRLQNTL